MTNRDHSPSVSQNDGGDAKSRTEGSGLGLDALEKVARAATPGPWQELHNTAGPMGVMAGAVDDEHVLQICWLTIHGREHANARHIATFDPQTVLRLIQTQRELVAALMEVSTCAYVSHDGHWNGGRNPILIARAAIAKASPPPSARPGEGGSIQTREDRQTLPSGDQ